MTRINIAIDPAELCDQHLVAEYRELPRMSAFAAQRLSKYSGCGPRPVLPTLNTGHMAYFLPYGAWLESRWLSLCAEMRNRGFTVNLAWIGYPAALMGLIPDDHLSIARPLLQQRIRQRIASMARRATWTASTRPNWA